MTSRNCQVRHHRGILLNGRGFEWIVQVHSYDRAKKLITTAFVPRLRDKLFVSSWIVEKSAINKAKNKVAVQTVIADVQ
jgi:hypothetical protein